MSYAKFRELEEVDDPWQRMNSRGHPRVPLRSKSSPMKGVRGTAHSSSYVSHYDEEDSRRGWRDAC